MHDVYGKPREKPIK